MSVKYRIEKIEVKEKKLVKGKRIHLIRDPQKEEKRRKRKRRKR